MCLKRPLSPRNVEGLPRGRGIDIGRETVRFGGTGLAPSSPESAGAQIEAQNHDSPAGPRLNIDEPGTTQ